jgi:hypothetical protein
LNIGIGTIYKIMKEKNIKSKNPIGWGKVGGSSKSGVSGVVEATG